VAVAQLPLALDAFVFADACSLCRAFFGTALTHAFAVTGMLVHDDYFLRRRIRDGAQQGGG
jgi:hypothetical protein